MKRYFVFAVIVLGIFCPGVTYADAMNWQVKDLVGKSDIVAIAIVKQLDKKNDERMIHIKHGSGWSTRHNPDYDEFMDVEFSVNKFLKANAKVLYPSTLIIPALKGRFMCPEPVSFIVGARYLVFLKYENHDHGLQSLRFISSTSGAIRLEGDKTIRRPALLDGYPPKFKKFNGPQLLDRIQQLIEDGQAPSEAEYHPDRSKKEMDLFEQATDSERKIEHLRSALRCRPNHPDNITVEYRLAVLIGQRTDPQTHQYIETGENKEIYERIVNNYNHMDYYRKEMPNHPRSPQILVPECALRAGFYQKDQEKKRGYRYKAMECLNQTYHRRKKDWEAAPAPKKPSEDSPFGGPLEISKWESRMFMWQKRKQDAAEGKVLHKIELRLMKRAVAAYLLTYLSKYDDKNHPSSNQGKISKGMVKIVKDFQDTPMDDYEHECGNIIINVLDRVRLKTN